MAATWDTLLHDNVAGYPTHKSRDRVPQERSVVYAQKIGTGDRRQVIRVGDELQMFAYGVGLVETTGEVYCKVTDDYVWRGCGGFDF
jgi:hypothetical protein